MSKQLSFTTDFQKVDQHTGEEWLIYGTKHRQDNQLQSLELSKHMYSSIIYTNISCAASSSLHCDLERVLTKLLYLSSISAICQIMFGEYYLPYRWLSAKWQHLQCVCTAVLQTNPSKYHHYQFLTCFFLEIWNIILSCFVLKNANISLVINY